MLGEFAGTFLFLFFAFAGTQVANTKEPDAAIAILSAGVVSALFPGPLNVRTALLPGTSLAQGLFIEMFLTAQLVFTILMLAAEKHKATFIAPVGIGLSLFIAELAGERSTSYIHVSSLRTIGIYWLGPILGALLAAGFYKLIKTLDFETANPGQDFDDRERDFFDPSKDTTRPIVNLAPDGSAFINEGDNGLDSDLPDVDNPGPELEHPPPPERRGRQSQVTSAAKSGRETFRDDEASESEIRYQKGPEAETGRATPRESGRV
ncbi:MAG: hypothetical protein Q9186_000576 [Xanthomendoza sp. 1 TL-2023]